MSLVSISRTDALGKRVGQIPGSITGKILLVKPPYFSPWTPPLGIAILKSFLESHGYSVKCYDFNSDPELWGMHHKYFTVLQALEDVSTNDGYSKLWWILNAHMLAYANGASPEACAQVLASVVPLQGMRIEPSVIRALLPLVENFYTRMNNLMEHFDLSEYAVVGTSTYTTSLGPSLFLLKNIKTHHPRIKTIMGGGAFADDLALGSDNLDTLVREYDYVDHFVLGEGELLLLKLLQGELAHKRLISIADLKGATLPMEEVPVPDFSDVGTDTYYHLTIEGARSCPFQCNFCSETIQWGDYRKRPMSAFADQVLELAGKYNNKSFFMGDSLMNPYINQFAGQLLERKADILYDGYLRADKPVTNRAFVKMWADSGCYRVRLGIESAAARVLDAMDKMTTPAVISDVLKTLANAGIRTTTYWITGFPGETEEEFQETCDFIREHHQYIYELEAHAYYYYPYGQIGSRLHQCHSIYPDNVTDIIKFKVWEINDANPPRVERFDRLRRVSELASNLGLPNIYTMAERFDAEERWHRLYPLALEVYEGTRLQRKLPHLPDHPIEVIGTGRGRTEAQTGADAVLCHRITVNTRLDEAVLAAAAREVVRYNDVLQLRLEDNRYHPVRPEDMPQAELVLSATPGDEDASDPEGFIRRTVENIAGQMRPEPNRSFRVVVVPGEASCELLVLAHRAVADAQGVAFLCEDLFRIYEQLSNNRELSLLPVKKTYTEALQELHEKAAEIEGERVPASAKISDGDSPAQSRAMKSETISIDKQVSRKLSLETLKESGLTHVEIITAALLRSLFKASGGDGQSIDVTNDFRSGDASLNHTVGMLTHIRELPAALYEQGELLAGVPRMRRSLQELATATLSPAPERDAAESRTLLNLEYFVEAPWLGGDLWTPRGFINPTGQAHGDYLLEIMPVLSRESLEIRFNYRDSEHAAQLVESIKALVAGELDSILDDCHRYATAKTFWLHEFKKGITTPNIEDSEEARDESTDNGWAVMPCELEPSILAEVSRKCEVDETSALLSSFGLLLSRLNGREEAVVLTSTMEGAERRWQPVKLKPIWNSNFDSFARQVEHKLAQAQTKGAYALDILLDELPKNNPELSKLMIDVAYVERRGDDDRQVVVDNLRARFSPVAQTLKLMLEKVDGEAGATFQLSYRKDSLSDELSEKIAAHLKTILQQAAETPNAQLGDIDLDQENESVLVQEILEQDVFSFGEAV